MTTPLPPTEPTAPSSPQVPSSARMAVSLRVHADAEAKEREEMKRLTLMANRWGGRGRDEGDMRDMCV